MTEITIFTPTYNRITTLGKLYDSLINQSDKRFEWLIVDDGSTDETQENVSNWIKDGLIEIRYFYQENRGKSYAHNVGVMNTKTELFVCVDSDDFLTINAVKDILEIKNDPIYNDIIGILSFKISVNNKPITVFERRDISITTLYDAYNKFGLNGDTMLVYKTDIIKMFYFPEFKYEKFVPEAYLYDKLDQVGKLYILRKYIYVCEYRDDGYTRNISNLLLNNPNGYILYLVNRINIDKYKLKKIVNIIKLVCFLIASNNLRMIREIDNKLFIYFLIIPCLPLSIYKYKLTFHNYFTKKSIVNGSENG